MNESTGYRDNSHVAIGLIIKAPRRDFEGIQEAITQNFPDSFIAYRCWDPGRLKIVRVDGPPESRRRGNWERYEE